MQKIDMMWEWNWPRKLFGDWATTIFEFLIYKQNFGDHAPGWHVSFTILNWRILDFGYYNLHHEDCRENCTDEDR
jgi:hypothetical protein